MKKHTRLISLLIVLCLFYLILPGSAEYSSNFRNNYGDDHLLLQIASIRSSLLCVVRDNLNNINNPPHSKSDLADLNSNLGLNYVFNDVSATNIPIDYRKNIRQSIPLYFNGSKYKSNYLVG